VQRYLASVAQLSQHEVGDGETHNSKYRKTWKMRPGVVGQAFSLRGAFSPARAVWTKGPAEASPQAEGLPHHAARLPRAGAQT